MSTQTEAQRLIEWIEGDMSCTGDKEIVAELSRLEAANAELLEAIKAEMDPSWECISYHPKLHAAIKKHGGAA